MSVRNSTTWTCERCQRPWTTKRVNGSPKQPCRSCKSAIRYRLTHDALPPREPSACQHCGVIIESPSRDQKWCSPACRDRAGRQAKRENATHLAECRLCSAPYFYTPGHDAQGWYCSRLCKGLHLGELSSIRMLSLGRRRANAEPKTCKVCDKSCLSSKRFCEEHKRLANGMSWLPCAMCGTSCMTYCSKRPACSEQCRALLSVRSKGMRRAKRKAILERDNWTCGICGESIDASEPVFSPRSATIDHIIPRARGGSDLAENLQAAHRECNLKKKDAVPQLF